MHDCIMPAAGASSRMLAREGGAAFKPLLPFAGMTLVEATARAALGAGCRLALVVGCRGEEVASLFDAPRYRRLREKARLLIVRNPRWAEGLLGSIQAGLASVRGEAFFVAHADMPFIDSADYAALSSARDAAAGGGRAEAAYVASFGGRWGHPVLVPASWVPEISALPSGEGLRPFLAERPFVLVETRQGALRDIDTAEDYESATR